jgi:hypothetical protein
MIFMELLQTQSITMGQLHCLASSLITRYLWPFRMDFLNTDGLHGDALEMLTNGIGIAKRTKDYS